MALQNSYPSHSVAVDAILAEGFSPSVHREGLWVKPSTRHDGSACTAIVRVTERYVDPAYGSNHFTVDFL